MALDRGDGAVDVGDRLTLGDLADEDLAGLGEGDDGGGGATALGVRDDGGLATLEDGDSRVGGTQVDTDSACHVMCSLWLLVCGQLMSVVRAGGSGTFRLSRMHSGL